MTKSLRTLVGIAAILVGGSLCMAEQIDNPTYKGWAKYKPGTSVTTKMVSEMAGTKSETETTTTLVELTADKAVVETKMSMVVGGNKMDMPANKMDVAAKIDKPAATTPAATAPAAKTTTEDVEVAGKKVKCTVTTVANSVNGMNTNSKVWTSEEVPGGMVKSETTMDGSMKGTTTMNVTAMTIK